MTRATPDSLVTAKDMIRARAPVRFDFAGGWTDVAEFSQESPGKVVNACLRLYSYATLTPNPLQHSGGVPYPDQKIELEVHDFDLYVEGNAVRRMEYDGNADLVKAAINRHIGRLPSGFKLSVRSDAPPGSGLGASAAMAVALLGVLSEFSRLHLEAHRIAEMAHTLERDDLGILAGRQDHYASVLGGFNSMEFLRDDVRTSPVPLGLGTVAELEKNCVLCYTSQPRLSGEIHERVRQAYRARRRTREAVEELKKIAERMRIALLRGDLRAVAELMNANWDCQKKLHPSVTNEQVECAFRVAMAAGAAGGKAGGAGGGGCVMFLCKPEHEHQVRQALEAEGVKVLDFTFDFAGLTLWRA